jgi:LmbE family N-acetylglucosaminyl deacetylase
MRLSTSCWLFALVGFLAFGVSPMAGAEKRSILAVFAHPDDEIAIGPLLAKYAAEGHDVHLAILTSGQRGVSNTDIPAGDQLGAAREEEARCSASALGIKPPHLLGYEDAGIATRPAVAGIVKDLRRIVDETKPDVMITWGPDGLTGHPDHRMASALATEVFQRRSWFLKPPAKLYYVALSESLLEGATAAESAALGAVADAYITTAVDGRKHNEAVFRAIQCHLTQWGPLEEIQQRYAAFQQGKSNDPMMHSVFGKPVTLRLALSVSEAITDSNLETDILQELTP